MLTERSRAIPVPPRYPPPDHSAWMKSRERKAVGLTLCPAGGAGRRGGGRRRRARDRCRFRRPLAGSRTAGGIPRIPRGRDWLGSHEPATGRLEWVPAAAAVDCSATLAASTGRWAYSNAAGGEPVAGHYLTIWRREPDGDWRAVLDHGIDHAAGASPSVLLAPAFDLLWPRNVQDCAPEGSAALLADAEAKLNRSTVRRGSAEALRRRVAEGAIAYRDDGPPALLTPEWPPGEASLGMGGLAQTDGTIVTDRSDLAVTYGSIRDADAGSESGSRVFYVRVWRYVEEGWRVAIDLQTPMPAEAAH